MRKNGHRGWESACFAGFLFVFGVVSSVWAAEVARPTFNKGHGFYDAPISVRISSATSGSTIRYTTDGSAPTATHGTVLANGGTVTLGTTTPLRAVGCKGGMTTSESHTQTYIFLASVLTQTTPSGYPASWGNAGTADYAMDSTIVNDSRYKSNMHGYLKSIPSMALTLDKNACFGSYGAYTSAQGVDYEKPCSAELIYANEPSNGFQINCGLTAHTWPKAKRFLRLYFRAEYGENKLNYPVFERAPLNAASGADVFDKLILRSGGNMSALSSQQTLATYARDQWSRDSQILMTGYGSHGLFVHLYINGLYWGLYNVAEKPDDHFCATYFEGGPTRTARLQYFWAKGTRSTKPQVSGPAGGPGQTRWDQWRGLVDDGCSDYVYNQYVHNVLDVDGYCDYVMLNNFTGVGDWIYGYPYQRAGNWYVGVKEGGLVRYFVWDAEDSWANIYWSGGAQRANAGAWVNPQGMLATTYLAFGDMWNGMVGSSNFKSDFADRVYKQMFNGGPLSDSACIARWDTLCANIEGAVVGESARWGDNRKDYHDGSAPVWTRHAHWYTARNNVRSLMSGNVAQFIAAFRAKGWYPNIDPPTYSKYGGTVSAGYQLTMSKAQSGTIYYRTDGGDPRGSSGVVASGAQLYSAPLTLSASQTVRARLKNGSVWSALAEASFTVGGGTPPPSAPSALSATAVSASQINLAWTDNSGSESGYKIDRRQSGTGNWVRIATPGANVTSYTDTGLLAETHFYYQVKAYNASGDSAYTAIAGASTPAAPVPAAPSGFTAEVLGPTEVRLTWQDLPDEDDYMLRRSLDGVDWYALPAVYPAADETSYTATGLEPETTYYFKIRGRNAGGLGPYCEPLSVDTPPATPPAIAVSTTSIAVSCVEGEDAPDATFQVWNGGAGTLTYNVTEATSKLDVAPTSGSSAGSADKQTHTVDFHTATLVPNTYVRHIAIEDNGSGAANSPVTITVQITVSASVPAAPSGFAAEVLGPTEVRLTWQDLPDEDDYMLRRSLDGIDWYALPAVYPAADETSYTATGLEPETTYYFKIRGRNAGGLGPYCEPLSVTTPCLGFAKGGTWRYRKGTSEASAPATAWRAARFDASGWAAGSAPFGYGPLSYGTTISDMCRTYSCVFLRRTFTVDEPAMVTELAFDVDYDDGFVLWVNGQELARVNILGERGSAVPFDLTASGYVSASTANWTQTFTGGALPELARTNVVAVQVLNNSIGSGDLMLDLALSLDDAPMPVADDADRDGLPDDYEGASGVTESGPDPDNDGLSNLDEYIAGTGSGDGADFFGVDLELSGGDLAVSFATIAASGTGYTGMTRRYALERREPGIGWLTVPGYENIEGTGQTVSYAVPAADASAHFRARVWLAY